MSIRTKLFAVLVPLAVLAASCGFDTGSNTEDLIASNATSENASTSSAVEPAAPAASEPESQDEDETEQEDVPATLAYDDSGVDCASTEVFCVGLVADVGSINDKSFNQSAWEGIQASVADFYDFRETSEAAGYAENIASFIDADFDVIVSVGFALGDPTLLAASENPDVLFIGVDQFQASPLPNVAGLIFPEDKAGFMAGALAGLMTESNVIGAVVGTDLVPPVVAFTEGFELGARYTNPSLAEAYLNYHPGDISVAFGDPEWGATTARQVMEQGADVVFGAGGATGNGALIEVASDGGDVFCIGVDADQWNTVPEARPCLITSAMKVIDGGVSDLITLAKDGALPPGNFVGEVALAPYHDFSASIPDDVKERMNQIIPQVLDGTIPTGFSFFY